MFISANTVFLFKIYVYMVTNYSRWFIGVFYAVTKYTKYLSPPTVLRIKHLQCKSLEFFLSKRGHKQGSFSKHEQNSHFLFKMDVGVS